MDCGGFDGIRQFFKGKYPTVLGVFSYREDGSVHLVKECAHPTQCTCIFNTGRVHHANNALGKLISFPSVL